MIPRGLILALSIGVAAGGIFGIFFVDLKNPNELNFVEGKSLSIVTEKTDFKKGEIIQIKIINSGTTPIFFSDASYGLKIRGLDGTILYSPVSAQVVSTLHPEEEKIFKWDQIKNDGDPILEGTYKITSGGFTPNKDIVKKSITVHILK
ncbi:MAG TPA: hypothetical protein VFG25_01440 [Nitrosopumilaceae archaeon]|nr:hypothetical protein [Nitrosopumilaceae archaeon]